MVNWMPRAWFPSNWFDRCLPWAPIVDASPSWSRNNIFLRDGHDEYQRKQQPYKLLWNFCPSSELSNDTTNVSIGEFKWSPIRVLWPRLWTHKVACHGPRSRRERSRRQL